MVPLLVAAVLAGDPHPEAMRLQLVALSRARAYLPPSVVASEEFWLAVAAPARTCRVPKLRVAALELLAGLAAGGAADRVDAVVGAVEGAAAAEDVGVRLAVPGALAAARVVARGGDAAARAWVALSVLLQDEDDEVRDGARQAVCGAAWGGAAAAPAVVAEEHAIVAAYERGAVMFGSSVVFAMCGHSHAHPPSLCLADIYTHTHTHTFTHARPRAYRPHERGLPQASD